MKSTLGLDWELERKEETRLGLTLTRGESPTIIWAVF